MCFLGLTVKGQDRQCLEKDSDGMNYPGKAMSFLLFIQPNATLGAFPGLSDPGALAPEPSAP